MYFQCEYVGGLAYAYPLTITDFSVAVLLLWNAVQSSRLPDEGRRIDAETRVRSRPQRRSPLS